MPRPIKASNIKKIENDTITKIKIEKDKVSENLQKFNKELNAWASKVKQNYEKRDDKEKIQIIAALSAFFGFIVGSIFRGGKK